MDNIKIAFTCVVLFAISIGLIILLLSTMEDPNKCKECDPLPVWISTNSSIIEINQLEKKAYILVSTMSRAIFFDFHFEQKEIYWVEEEEESEKVRLSSRIYKTGLQSINKTGKEIGVFGDPGPRLVVEMGACGGLALDWLHSHIYWIHRDEGLIVEATLDGGHRRIVYDKAISDIYNIAVDPVRRYIFWTESPRMKNTSLHITVKIRSSDLRGNNVLTLASVEGGWARTLGVDVTERRLYYIERTIVLMMCDYDGGNKVVVRSGLPHPLVITVSNKQVFWTSSEGDVKSILKHSSKENENTFPVQPSVCPRCSHVEKESMFGPKTYLRVVDGRMQPIPETNHHSYRDCLFNVTNFSNECPCPFGYKIINPSHSCKEEGYFVAIFNSEIKAISMKGKTLPLLAKGQTQLSSVDFHYIRGFLFWYDSTEAKIFRSPLLNPSQRQTIVLMVRGVTSLAVDWTYDHLYWTSNNRDGGSVEVCKLDGSVRMTVIPRDRGNLLVSIAVHPEEGTMYISNWTEGSVEIFAMDGSAVQRLASGLTRPRGLTINLQYEKQIYWLESIDNRWQQSTIIIKACYLERREDCQVVYKSLPGFQPSSFTVLGSNVYWLERSSIKYVGINQKTRPGKINLGRKQAESLGLKVIHSHVQVPMTNHCVFASCRGLCVPTPRDWGQSSVRCIQRSTKYKPPQHYASIGL